MKRLDFRRLALPLVLFGGALALSSPASAETLALVCSYESMSYPNGATTPYVGSDEHVWVDLDKSTAQIGADGRDFAVTISPTMIEWGNGNAARNGQKTSIDRTTG